MRDNIKSSTSPKKGNSSHLSPEPSTPSKTQHLVENDLREYGPFILINQSLVVIYDAIIEKEVS